jgi:hypothetical protein
MSGGIRSRIRIIEEQCVAPVVDARYHESMAIGVTAYRTIPR